MTYSAQFLPALRTSHTLALRLDVTWPDGSTTTDLPFSTGSVTVDATQPVRRSLSLELPGDQMDAWKDIAFGGATLRPYRGVEYVDGSTELAPLGVFPVHATSRDPGGLTAGKLTAPDRWYDVNRRRFLSPQAGTETTTAGQWYAFVAQCFPTGTFSFSNLSGDTSALVHNVWTRDRSAACLDLAAAIGCEGFFNELGDPVLRPVPPVGTPTWTVDASETGVLVTGTSDADDQQAYSVVVVSSSRTTGAVPFEQVVVKDLNTSSKTYSQGPFGEVPTFYSNPSIDSATQAQTAAAARLLLVTGNAGTVSLTSLVNPALLEGSTIEVIWADGSRELHVVEGFTVALDDKTGMAIKTRSRTVTDS